MRKGQAVENDRCETGPGAYPSNAEGEERDLCGPGLDSHPLQVS